MSDFIYYDLECNSLDTIKKSKIDEEALIENISFKSKKSDAILSPVEVASAIIKELIKLEEIYADLNIIDIYNVSVNNFCTKFPELKLILTLDKDYYPMLTPDISLNPPVDPIFMYEMISHPDLDRRNTGKIRNINYIISRVNTFLLDYNLECKLNHDITNNMVILLKTNNYKMKVKEPLINTNVNIVKPKNSGIGYGGSDVKWDANAYLNDVTRIKELNETTLENIFTFLESNPENKDLFEIHERFNLNTFWIDILEKYEITDNKYYNSIKNIMYIINYLNLKIKIPFLDMFKSTHEKDTSGIINTIKEYIQKIQEIDTSTENSINNEYVTILQPLQADSYPYVEKKKHNFVKEVSEFTNFDSTSAFRFIVNQYEIISKSLPLTSEHAIFFRQDPDNICMFKFAVIPNEDTPYKFGIFVFDVFLPKTFPNTPPVVSHTTSRKNNFRFNPNLYANGYVCLSLLGTWPGPGWVPLRSDGTGSTLYQVIMSISAMVFSEEPWFNEPSREVGIMNAATNTYAQSYNKDIVDGTIKYAIINQLKYPEEGFEDVIKEHFRLKKNKVIEYLKGLKKDNELKLFESLV
jgi:ubiquitin-protein ligase